MYQSSIYASKAGAQFLRIELVQILRYKNSIYSKALKRKVFFDKLPEVLLARKDCKHRLQCFIVSLDILKKSKTCTVNPNNDSEFEVLGLAKNGEVVRIHLREELDEKKNKKVYFVSCFYK